MFRKVFTMALALLLLFSSTSFAYKAWRYREHATDCTALTDGKESDICRELDSEKLYRCEPSSGDCDTSGEWVDITSLRPEHVVYFTSIDGGGSAIDDTVTDPVFCARIQQDSVITAWYLSCDQTGSIVLDVWKNTWNDTPLTNSDSIASTEKPTLSSDVSASDTSLTAMTTDWNSGDEVCIEIESASTVTKCMLYFEGYND